MVSGADALNDKGGNVISRFEKVILICLAGLGAGYWGYGLLLLFIVPGDYNYYIERFNWFLAVLEGIIGTGIFLSFELAIIKNWVKERRKAWSLFFIVLAGSVLYQYVYFKLFGPLY